MVHKNFVLISVLALAACGGEAANVVPSKTTQPSTTDGATTSSSPAAAAAPEAPKAPVALEEYFKIRRIPPFSRSGLPLLSFSPDETKVAYASDEGGRIDIWVRDVAAATKPVQVTHVEGFVHSFAFSPKDDILVFEADRGGDELPRLYATDSKGSAARELVPELPAGRRTQFVEWAKDGATFLYLSSARDEKALDLVEYDLKTKKSTIVWQASGTWSFAKASEDHKRFAIVDVHDDVNTDIHLVERGKKGSVLLTEHTGSVRFDPATFSPDGKILYATSDEGHEFTQLIEIDVATKKRTTTQKESWDVEDADFSGSGRYFYTLVNDNGTTQIKLTDKTKKAPKTLPTPPGAGSAWRPLTFSKSDRFIGATLIGDTIPTSSYVIDLEKGTFVQILDPMPESLRNRPMVASEAVSITSFDGKTVPAFLYKPEGKDPMAAIIDVHGGPTAQSKRGFAAFRQYAVSKGYAVLVPNVRGSTGYGKTYMRLDNLDFGGGPLKDVVACKKWLVEKARVPNDKVVVMGGSYGGYMALAAEAFTPDEFAANVDFFGVSELKSLVESFPPYWAAFSASIYQKFGDPKNPAHAAYLHDRSPLYFTHQMKRPLLVVQGDKDPRVKKDQSDRIVEALKKSNVPVHYLVLENEGHGFTKSENNLRALQATDRFLDRYVFGDTRITVLP